MDATDLSTAPDPMPSIDEILDALRTQAKTYDPEAAVPITDLVAAQVLASGDTSRHLIDNAALVAMSEGLKISETELAIRVMVCRANHPPPETSHANFWRFYHTARALMAERPDVTRIEDLVVREEHRHELIRRCLTPEDYVAEQEWLFRIWYRIALNLLLLEQRTRQARIEILAAVASPWTRRTEHPTVRLPERMSADTAQISDLNEENSRQLRSLAEQNAYREINNIIAFIRSVWGNDAFGKTFQRRLTATRFIEQAELPSAQ